MSCFGTRTGVGATVRACRTTHSRKIVDVGKAGGKFKMIAFTPTGGWSFFWDRNTSWNTRIPEAAAQKIKRPVLAAALKMIAFTQDNPYDPSVPYVLDAKPARRVKAVLTTDIAYPHAHVDEWYLYAPCAPNLPGQRLGQHHLRAGRQTVQEESPLKRPVFLTRITDGRKTVHTVLTIERPSTCPATALGSRRGGPRGERPARSASQVVHAPLCHGGL